MAIRGPRQARFWLGGVEAGETWAGEIAGAVAMEQLPELQSGRNRESEDRELAMRVYVPKRPTLCSERKTNPAFSAKDGAPSIL